MGEAHGSEAETATSQLPNGKLGATLCRGRSPPSDTQCGWRASPGVLVATTRGRFVFLPVTGLSSDRQLIQTGVLQNLA